MSSERREAAKSFKNNDDGATNVQEVDEILSRGVVRCGVSDTRQTIDSRHVLDADVESDALISCEPDERSCYQPNSVTGSRVSPPFRIKGDTPSGLQETVGTSSSSHNTRTAEGGRLTAAETVMLTSRGVTSNWGHTVVKPIDESRSSTSRHLPHSETSGGHSAVASLVRENAKLRELNKHQAEKIYQLTTEATRSGSLQSSSSDEVAVQLQLLKEQMALYKEDFENERRDKERALSEKDSLIKQTKTLLNEVRVLQDRNMQLESALQVARQNALSDDEARRSRFASRWADND